MTMARYQTAKILGWLADRSFHTYNNQSWLPMPVRRFFYSRAFMLLDLRDNMFCCRFENTYRDLRGCHESMMNGDELSESERKFRNELIELCKSIADEFSNEGEYGGDYDYPQIDASDLFSV